jgi:DNA-binding transcriptional regulator YiaG
VIKALDSDQDLIQDTAMRKHKTEKPRGATPASTMSGPRQAREAAGLSREELAARAGCSYGTVRDCEANGRWPRNIAMRRAYLAALGLAVAP